MEYRDALPAGCPPDEAEEIAATTDIYRLVRNNPPSADDFLSQQSLNPSRSFGSAGCMARGLSVRRTKSACELMLKLPRFTGASVCLVRLMPGHGRIQQTGKAQHYTWWPHRGFNHATCTQIIAA